MKLVHSIGLILVVLRDYQREGGGARKRIDTFARVVTALDRHLIVSFPERVPAKLKDAVQVA